MKMLKNICMLSIGVLTAFCNAEDSKIITVIKDAPKEIFEIKNTVLNEKPLKFGYNMKGFKHGKMLWMNMFSVQWGMEPYKYGMEIFLNDVSLCTKTRISNGRVSIRGWGSKGVPGSFFKGGTITQFRNEGHCYKQIHTSKIKDAYFHRDKNGMYLEGEEEYIIRDTPGPVPVFDDVIVLHTSHNEIPFLWDEYDTTKDTEKGICNGARNIKYIGNEVLATAQHRKAWFMKIADDKSPYKGSNSCLLMRFPGFKLKSHQNIEDTPLKSIDKSKKYAKAAYLGVIAIDPVKFDYKGYSSKNIIVKFWARQEYIDKGQVIMDLYNNKHRNIFTVTNKWKQFTFNYKITNKDDSTRKNGLMFTSKDPGRFYIDGFEFSEKGKSSGGGLDNLADDLLDGLEDDDGGTTDIFDDVMESNIASAPKKEIKIAEGDRASMRKRRLGSIIGWTTELSKEDGSVRFIYDKSTACPEGESTGSLCCMTLKGESFKFEGIQFDNAWLGKGNISEGTTMKVEFWAKQKGLTNGEITMDFSKNVCKKEFKITNDWKKYEFEFKPNTNDPQLRFSEFSVKWRGVGKLWLDNLLVYRAELPPFALMPKHLKAVKELNPGTMRLWGGTSISSDWRDGWLKGMMAYNRSGTSLQKQLEFADSADSNIWLISKFFPSDEEISALMEFLAAPADVGYGKKRAEQGRKKPWTKAFDTIYIEAGNESMYYFQYNQYTALANRLFKEFKANKYYNPKQFKFVFNNNAITTNVYPEWKPEFMEFATEADFIDNCVYVGGADGISTGPENLKDADNIDDFYQHVLLNSEISHAKHFELLIEERDNYLKEHPDRKKWEIACYEGGPGASLGVTDPEASAFSHLVSDSMLIAIPTIDAFMRSLQYNGGYSCLFHYGGGGMWSSHNSTSDMFPKPASLALILRNTYCSGKLLNVEKKDGLLVNIPPHPFTSISNSGGIKHGTTALCENVNLVKCFTFKDKNKYSIMVYNMSAREDRKVQLKLPTSVKSNAELYYLQDDDLLNGNIEKYNVKIKNKKISDFSSDYTFTIPKASIYVFNVLE